MDLINTISGSVTVNYSQSIETVEIRFRTDNVITNPTMPSTMNLMNIGSNSVTLDYTSGTLGTIRINGNASSNIEMFDGGWITAMVREVAGDLEVVAKRSKYGKIVAAVSASVTSSAFPLSGSVVLGVTSSGAVRLRGQLQELRIWSSSLFDTTFNNHVKAPAAYNANLNAYNELIFRIPLTQKINHVATSSLPGVQPLSSSMSASFANWISGSISYYGTASYGTGTYVGIEYPYDSIEEIYYYDAPSLGAGTFDDNKIRLEENDLIGTLDVKTRAERSQFDKAPLDSKKLGVYFSPQTMIDEDIIAQLAFTKLDDYIGDPGESDSKSYPRLIQQANSYWKKYADRNDINSYINMFTLFDLSFFRQLEQLLPARADKLTGILIQPNLLERSKDTILPKIKKYDSGYSVEIMEIAPSASGDYLQYLGSVDGNIMTISGIDDDQWQMYLTASTADKYDGTTYSYEYLLHSGSTWITASTPYWMSEAVGPTIISSVISEYRSESGSVSFVSGSFTGSFAQVQDFIPRGIENHRYAGTKMSSSGFNINSIQTYDGGPVVEWRTTNANQLLYQQNGDQGSFVLV